MYHNTLAVAKNPMGIQYTRDGSLVIDWKVRVGLRRRKSHVFFITFGCGPNKQQN